MRPKQTYNIGPRVAELLRKKRKELGLNYVEFGKLIGVSERAVSYWESGERIPTDIEVIDEAFKKLGISLMIGK